MAKIDMPNNDWADIDMAKTDMLTAQADTPRPMPACAGQTRILGFAPHAGVDALLAVMAAVPGPEPYTHSAGPGSCPTVAALVQSEPDVPLLGRGRKALAASLLTVQRRLEIGCQAGPFLAMDPAAACCPSAGVPRLLATQWDALESALAQYGALQQWDIELKWAPQDVVASHRAEIAPAAALGQQALAEAVAAALRAERGRREAALLAALGPAVLDFAAGGAACTDTAVAVTVLVASGNEAAVEAALDAMAPQHVDGASIDMRGPLPPLSFFPVRLANVEAQTVASAWATLGLADRTDLPDLHRQWRLRAAAVHPDRQTLPPTADAAVSDLTDAYRLLRGLLPPDAANSDHSLNSLMRHAGRRLVIPACTTQCDPPDRPAPQQVKNPVLELLS